MNKIKKNISKIALVFVTLFALMFAVVPAASAAPQYGVNTCWGTGKAIKTTTSNGRVVERGCNWEGTSGQVSSAYPFRVRLAGGSEVCYNAGFRVYPTVTWRAWTVSNC